MLIVSVKAGCPHVQVRLCNEAKSRFPSWLLLATFIESAKVKYGNQYLPMH